jgi:xanthine dehydrogenase accessory factor
MKDLVDVIDSWPEPAERIGRAVVIRTFGSAPRLPGASLLLSDVGRIAGSVSGGCVESAAVEEIERARATGRSRVVRYGISDEEAWGVGLSCGGTLDVLIEPSLPTEVLEAARLVRHGRTGARAVVTVLPPGSPGDDIDEGSASEWAEPGPRVVVHSEGQIVGGLGSEAIDAAVAEQARRAITRGSSRTLAIAGQPMFMEVFPLRPRLVVVGAEQVAMALVRFAAELGYETIVVDHRAAFAQGDRFPEVDELVIGWLDEISERLQLGPADAVAVLSHDVNSDVPAIVEALRRDCRYVGLIGSGRTQADRRQRLRDAGVAEADLARLRGPIGLDLGGRGPAETALAIMAEVIAERNDGTGAPMSRRAPRAPPEAPA